MRVTMKALKQIALLKVPSLVPERPTQEQETRVVELFRNRAELKKAYGDLQTEIHRLKDRLKQQEAATGRVQEALEVLETRLGATEPAFSTVVFYHLRGLWQLGRELLEQLIGDLARQHEQRERKLQVEEFERQQNAKREALEGQLRETEAQRASARQRLFDLGHRRMGLTRFWHYFKRREVDAQLEVARRAGATADAAFSSARDAVQALNSATVGPFPGLSIEARRAINLAAIGYGEVLCLRLGKSPVMQLARDAVSRREGTDEYGSRPECEALIAEIARVRALMQDPVNMNEEIRARVERLRKLVRYGAAEDTFPTADSVAPAPPVPPTQAAKHAPAGRPLNVLAEDTWDLFRILLR